MSEQDNVADDAMQARLRAIATEFGGGPPIQHLPGGMGHSYRVASAQGSLVIKPAPHAEEAQWLGETFAQLPDDSENVRIPHAVIGRAGNWIVDDHVCWSWLDGRDGEGRYSEKIAASRAFHQIARVLEKPTYIDRRSDPWAMADRVAWGERPADYDAETMQVLEPVLSEIGRTSLPPGMEEQLIHGDLSGNFVFAPGLAPGIIDITPYWRTVGFAEAVMWIDSIWFDAPADPRKFDRPGMHAFVLRALARRMAEQPEQVAAGQKSRDSAAMMLTRLNAEAGRLIEAFRSV
jgi:hypothetical protein